MDWEINNNIVRHLETGLTVIVEEGSFHEPYWISVSGDHALSPILTTRLVKDGIAFGAKQESTSSPLTITDNEKPAPTVVVKKRKHY
jgi:hypothetical protein